MDFISNKYIPKSTDNKLILRPTGKTFVNGLAPSYELNYERMLERYISEKEFTKIIEGINEILFTFWPCCLCFTCGYLFCPCTLGLSFMLPNVCISEAKIKLFEELYTINLEKLNPKNLHLSYRSKCSTSWLEVEILDKSSQSISKSFQFDNDKGNRYGFIRNQEKK